MTPPAAAAVEPFVLDTSLTLAWCFPDEHAPYPQAVLDSLVDRPAIVPSLWRLEVVNALLVGERKGRCTEADTDQWTAMLETLPIDIDPETDRRAWRETAVLARKHNLTSYDASYLELALRRKLPLASLDTRLNDAAKAAGVPLYTP